jgi:hypothetical protein
LLLTGKDATRLNLGSAAALAAKARAAKLVVARKRKPVFTFIVPVQWGLRHFSDGPMTGL